jgi:hypothetical protein
MSISTKKELIDLEDDQIKLDYGVIDKEEYDPNRFRAKIRVTRS